MGLIFNRSFNHTAVPRGPLLFYTNEQYLQFRQNTSVQQSIDRPFTEGTHHRHSIRLVWLEVSTDVCDGIKILISVLNATSDMLWTATASNADKSFTA